MSLGSVLARGRSVAESLMRDTVLVQRQTGTTTDPVTLEDTPTYATVYTGKARVQRPGNQPTDLVAGEVEFGIEAVIAQLPLTATGIDRNHRITVTALGPESDPDLLGLIATIKANLTKSHPTKRTLVCEEVS